MLPDVSHNEFTMWTLRLTLQCRLQLVWTVLWLCCCGCGLSRADYWWTYCRRTTDYGGNGKYIGMLTDRTTERACKLPLGVKVPGVSAPNTSRYGGLKK